MPCVWHRVRGTLLLAREGINGTIAGSADDINRVIDHIRQLPGCTDLQVKFSQAETMPFNRMKVRLKKEIVTMGQPDLDPLQGVGTYVDPQDWNALIADPDTLLIDTRNDYEVQIGTFAGAIDPQTTSFREFPQWFRAKRAELEAAGRTPKIAMFCTGGIRCEKSTALPRPRAWRRCSTSRAESSNISRPFRRSKACGRANASSSTSGSASVTALHRATTRMPRLPPSGERRRPQRRALRGRRQLPALFAEQRQQRARYAERQRQERLAAERGEEHVGRRENASDDEQQSSTVSAAAPMRMRARMALHVSGFAYEHREVVLRDKPAAMLEVSPKGTVPVS